MKKAGAIPGEDATLYRKDIAGLSKSVNELQHTLQALRRETLSYGHTGVGYCPSRALLHPLGALRISASSKLRSAQIRPSSAPTTNFSPGSSGAASTPGHTGPRSPLCGRVHDP